MKRKAILFSVFAAGTILLSAPSSAYLETRSKLLTEYQPITLDVNDTLLVLSIIAFSMALVCYTTGVFSEMIAKELKPWHVKIFWLGFLFEICGAIPMFMRSEKGNISLHKIVGAIGLALIITHNVLASIAIRTNLDIVLKLFPKFSAFVYAIWLIAFITGMIIGMKKQEHSSAAF
ncbi:MAG: TIGR03987 family protein [Thermoplasmata archaeon]|nr:TIGR03987 family protein [Thermoplasmata archaeon]